MSKNVKEVELILTDVSLKRFKVIPTFYNMLHWKVIERLHIGTNIVSINHFTFSRLKNMEIPGDYKIVELKN